MREDNKKTAFRSLLFSMTLLFGALFAASAYLKYQTPFVGENPIVGICEKRSHIPVTGKDHTFSDRQENEEKKQEESQEEKKPVSKQMSEVLEVKREKSSSFPKKESSLSSFLNESSGSSANETGIDGEGETEGTNGSNHGNGGTGEAAEDSKQEPEETPPKEPEDETESTEGELSKLPIVTCSLEEGQRVSGTFLGFTVHAVTYRNVSLDAFQLKVTVNGNKLYSSGNQNGTVSYRTSQELQDGENEIVITATDKEGYMTQKTYHVVVNADEEKKEGGTMRVQLKAEVLGLGTLFDERVTCYEGENLPYVIDRAFRQAGVMYHYTGTFDYGFYLQRVYRQSVTDGYQIPAPIIQKLEEENCSWVGFEKDSLGEKDFYYWSGWVYRMDGYFPEGLSSVPAEDGSVVEILFSLNNGAEYNGTWFLGMW